MNQILRSDEPLGAAVVESVRGGDVEGLRRLLGDNSGLATKGVDELVIPPREGEG